MKIRPWLSLLIIVAGIVYSLFLLHQIPEGVYFGGDAGLKALVSQQLAQGTGRIDLISPTFNWVKDLWKLGLYPYQPPFVYPVGDRYFITFPFTFPLLTAPFYRLWGYFGLYVLPLLGIWAVWGLFYGFCRLLNYGERLTALGLVILIFASPLTIYGAIYWEHSLAVALGMASGVLILWARQRGEPFRLKAVRLTVMLAGICLGLTVWLRPEFLAVLALAIAIALAQEGWNYGNRWHRRLFNRSTPQLASSKSLNFIPQTVCFSLSALGTTLLFFVSNHGIYGHYLGMHGLQALEKVPLTQKITTAIAGIEGMGLTLIRVMPIVCWIGFYGLALCLDRPRLKPHGSLLMVYGLSGVLLVAIAFFVPPGTAGLIPGGKQWGSRFLLMLVPLLILATLKALKLVLQDCRPELKYLGMACLAGLLGLSLHKNSLEGTAYLKKSYQDIAPAIAFLQSQPDSVIAISHQFVAQVLQPSVLGNKLWFRVENSTQLQLLTPALQRQNITQFLYICYPFAPCPVPQLSGDCSPKLTQSVYFQFLGKKGKYPLYKASIPPQ